MSCGAMRPSTPVAVPSHVVVHKHERSNTAAYQWRTKENDKLESTLAELEAVVLRTGEYIEVMETQVHGERVCGRIHWEVLKDNKEELNRNGRTGDNIEGGTTYGTKRSFL